MFSLHINTKGNSLVRYSGDGSRRTPVTGDGAISVGGGKNPARAGSNP